MSTKPHVQVTFISLILCFLCGQGLAQDGAMWGYRIAVDLSDCRALENGDSLVSIRFFHDNSSVSGCSLARPSSSTNLSQPNEEHDFEISQFTMGIGSCAKFIVPSNILVELEFKSQNHTDNYQKMIHISSDTLPELTPYLDLSQLPLNVFLNSESNIVFITYHSENDIRLNARKEDSIPNRSSFTEVNLPKVADE